jgi:transposase InsO family protein
LDVGTRRIVHWNATEHPTAAWTVQQFRAITPGDQPQRFVIHDRDSIYSSAVDGALAAMGLTVMKTPVRCPQANAFCERLIGTIRRECLDWVIVLDERHLRDCPARVGEALQPGSATRKPRPGYSRHAAVRAAKRTSDPRWLRRDRHPDPGGIAPRVSLRALGGVTGSAFLLPALFVAEDTPLSASPRRTILSRRGSS